VVALEPERLEHTGAALAGARLGQFEVEIRPDDQDRGVLLSLVSIPRSRIALEHASTPQVLSLNRLAQGTQSQCTRGLATIGPAQRVPRSIGFRSERLSRRTGRESRRDLYGCATSGPDGTELVRVRV